MNQGEHLEGNVGTHRERVGGGLSGQNFQEDIGLGTNMPHHRKNRRNTVEDLCGSFKVGGELTNWSYCRTNFWGEWLMRPGRGCGWTGKRAGSLMVWTTRGETGS